VKYYKVLDGRLRSPKVAAFNKNLVVQYRIGEWVSGDGVMEAAGYGLYVYSGLGRATCLAKPEHGIFECEIRGEFEGVKIIPLCELASLTVRQIIDPHKAPDSLKRSACATIAGTRMCRQVKLVRQVPDEENEFRILENKHGIDS